MCLFSGGRTRDYEGAKAYFDKAAAKAPYNGQLYLLSVNCILKSVENPYVECMPLDGKFSDTALQRLKDDHGQVK